MLMATHQVAFRLSDGELAVLDQLVAEGSAKDRTAALRRVLRAEQRRRAAEHDATVYALHGEDPEIEAFLTAANREYPSLD